ncbi:MAG: hypothetical protein IJ181_12775 [Acidaminococcaceae bacterium]|nr:hypothetical protein [Acidaminococcaceae bacterium]
MTEKDARNILTKFGYILEKYKGHYNLIDRRNMAFISAGYALTLEDVEKWIRDNLDLSNLYSVK